MSNEEMMEYITNAEIASKKYTTIDRPTREEKGENKMKKLNKQRAIKGAVLVGAGILLYRLGERNGFDLGYELGELNGFRDAVKAVTEGAVDAYNLGDLESFGE